jgi:hypothetical protein
MPNTAPLNLEQADKAVLAEEWKSTFNAPSPRHARAGYGVGPGYVSRVIQLAFLAPDIVKGIIEGRQPIELTAESLMRNRKIPTDWRKQRRLLGFAELTASE